MIEAIKALTKTELYPQVKAAIRAGGAGAMAAGLCSDGLAILAAIQAGWFLLPAGRGNTYSKAQFFALRRAFEFTPWNIAFTQFATAADNKLLAKVGAEYHQSLWTCPGSLESFASKARTLCRRTPRIPFEWASGALTVELVAQALIDSYNLCRYEQGLITGLTETGALEPGKSISEQINALIDINQSYFIPQLLTSTRRFYMDREAKYFLEKVLGSGKRGESFEMFLLEREAEQEDKSRTEWQRFFNLAHHAAAVLDNMGSSEHLGTVNRRLKEAGAPAYRVTRTETPAGAQLTMTVAINRELGRAVQIETVWEFRNWVLALSAELLTTKPCYQAYLEAEQRAKAKIELDGTDERPAWRPYDDFEDADAPGRARHTIAA